MSSTTESGFDIEMFIHAIQERPVIWDLSLNEYSDRILKRKAWEEVCNQFINDFSTKSSKQKSEEALKLQKKWKSIIDAYTRSKNKKVKSGSGAYSGRDYVYSNILSFLNPLSETRKPPLPTSEETSQSQRNITNNITLNQRKRKIEENNERDDALIDILAERMAKKKEEDNQPDRLFLMSLVEEFESIHPDYKMDARMEILNTIKKYKQMSRSSVQNYNFPSYYTATGWQFSSPSTHMPTLNREDMQTPSFNFQATNSSQNVMISPQPKFKPIFR